jgi:hypothetical protein
VHRNFNLKSWKLILKLFIETAELIGINGEIGTVMEEDIPGK